MRRSLGPPAAPSRNPTPILMGMTHANNARYSWRPHIEGTEAFSRHRGAAPPTAPLLPSSSAPPVLKGSTRPPARPADALEAVLTDTPSRDAGVDLEGSVRPSSSQLVFGTGAGTAEAESRREGRWRALEGSPPGSLPWAERRRRPGFYSTAAGWRRSRDALILAPPGRGIRGALLPALLCRGPSGNRAQGRAARSATAARPPENPPTDARSCETTPTQNTLEEPRRRNSRSRDFSENMGGAAAGPSGASSSADSAGLRLALRRRGEFMLEHDRCGSFPHRAPSRIVGSLGKSSLGPPRSSAATSSMMT